MNDIVLCEGCEEIAKKIGVGIYEGKLRIYRADEKIRPSIERRKPDMMYGAETIQPKEFIHQRGSGLNQVICRLMKEKGIMYAFSFSMILNARDQSIILGRIMQNIRLLRKYKVPMLVLSLAEKPEDMRSPEDMASLFRDLGMHNKEIKEGWALLEKQD